MAHTPVVGNQNTGTGRVLRPLATLKLKLSSARVQLCKRSNHLIQYCCSGVPVPGQVRLTALLLSGAWVARRSAR